MSRARPAPGSYARCGAGAVVLAFGLLAGAACTGDPQPTPGPAATPVPTTTPEPPSGSGTPVAEPTTTNTLPLPPAPTAPAPSTAGGLSAASVPVPAGWRTVVLPGGDEEGYRGNGRWVHARDPRYAAQDVVTIGCADVTRDDYTDPTAALEGNLRRGKDTGVALVLDFADPGAAQDYLSLYTAQVRACSAPGQDVRTSEVREVSAADGGRGLVDRRTYPDAQWTEVAELNATRLTLLILGDPGHRMSTAQSDALLAQIQP